MRTAVRLTRPVIQLRKSKARATARAREQWTTVGYCTSRASPARLKRPELQGSRLRSCNANVTLCDTACGTMRQVAEKLVNPHTYAVSLCHRRTDGELAALQVRAALQ